MLMAMKPLDKKTLEKAIEAELMTRVKALGGRCDKVGALGRRGFFDRIVVLPGGRVIFVEVKRPRGGNHALHQQLWMSSYKLLGAEVALVAKSEDIDALLRAPTPSPK